MNGGANARVFGGYNIGNTIEDNMNNRLVVVGNKSGGTGQLQLVHEFGVSNRQAVDSSSGASDAEYIRFKASGIPKETWRAGTYLLAVK